MPRIQSFGQVEGDARRPCYQPGLTNSENVVLTAEGARRREEGFYKSSSEAALTINNPAECLQQLSACAGLHFASASDAAVTSPRYKEAVDQWFSW
jgi:hypothetical protein